MNIFKRIYKHIQTQRYLNKTAKKFGLKRKKTILPHVKVDNKKSLLCKLGIHKYAREIGTNSIKLDDICITPQFKFCNRCGKLKEIR
ncbi:MAG TPA: hypothetical protein DEF85_06035 [Clostridiaceae bacterium]|nr:hypothetical protein [Clostridiaceae bacterium]